MSFMTIIPAPSSIIMYIELFLLNSNLTRMEIIKSKSNNAYSAGSKTSQFISSSNCSSSLPDLPTLTF